MNKLRNFLVVVILLTNFGPLATAEQKNSVPGNLLISSNQSNISQQQAVDIAQKHIQGRVLAINRVDNAYHVKILSSEGTVHVVQISIQDGSVISVH